MQAVSFLPCVFSTLKFHALGIFTGWMCPLGFCINKFNINAKRS